tara:strand:- start:101 stop:1180 length:1080 start_codon:yes stop_codon:yes gene_type:complete
LSIAEASKKKGYDISIGYGEIGDINPNIIKNKGFKIYPLSMHRGGTNFFQEINTIYSIWKLLKEVQPDILHLVTIKPYLYGGIVARLTKVPCVVSAITGLGSLFIQNSFKNTLIRILLYPIFKFALGHKNQSVIVQNNEDSEFLMDWGVLDLKKTILIKGSGVNLSKFSVFDEPKGVPVICFVGRLLKDKGVNEFVSAARILNKRGVNARFQLAGQKDFMNPTGLKAEEINYIHEEGIVEVLGYQKDISILFAKSHIICLPSYREGLPKALLEAAAASRAIVTTDVPGCRQSIIPNKSGLLVPVKDYKKLADAIQWLINHPVERIAMGKIGRQLAQKEFRVEKITQSHLAVYQKLISKI